MKKSYLMLVVIALTAIFATGCSSMNTSDAAKIAAIGTNPVRYDVITSVQNHPVTGEASHSRLFWIFTWGDDDFADNATFVASKAGAADSPLDTVVAAYTWPFGLFSGIFGGDVYDDVKKAASYNACKASKAYSLIAARYEINTSNYLIFRRISCTVTGYPVKILGFKESGGKVK